MQDAGFRIVLCLAEKCMVPDAPISLMGLPFPHQYFIFLESDSPISSTEYNFKTFTC